MNRSIRSKLIAPLAIATGSLAAWGQPFLYVTNQNANSVSVVDTRNNSLAGNTVSSFSPSGAALSPDGSRLFVANPNANLVVVYNTSNSAVITSFTIGQLPSAVAADAQRLYVTLHGSAALAVFNAANFAQVASIRVGFGPNAVAVSSANGRVYVANTYSSTISVIDPTRIGTPNSPVIATIPVPDSPVAIAMSADGQTAYVACTAMNKLARINLQENRVASEVTLPISPAGVAVSPDGTRAYVTGYGSKVATVDIQRASVVGTNAIPACPAPRCVAMSATVSSDGRTVYVANTSMNQIAVMDASTGAVSANIAVQAAPRAVVLGLAPRPATPTEAQN
jgi:YVTN family beta-propeller protein